MTVKSSERLHILTESAIMIALSAVLSLIKIYEAPFGGSITLISMAPIVILSLHRGVGVGLSAGAVEGVIQLFLGLGNVGWVPSIQGKILCILFDYIVPFTILGFGGMFRNVKFSDNSSKSAVAAAVLGALTVTLLRYLCHIVSGVAVWYALDLEWYADDPAHIVNRYSKWLFSAIYNGSFMLPEIALTTISVPVISMRIMKRKK